MALAGCCAHAGRSAGAGCSDGLALGEATARSLGLPLAPMRAALVAVLALATGTAVAQTGLIAFVGLAAPHLVRSLVKAPHAADVAVGLMGGVLAAGCGHAGPLADGAAGTAGGRADRGARRRLPAVADAPARDGARTGAN
jgi:hypothetical protein